MFINKLNEKKFLTERDYKLLKPILESLQTCSLDDIFIRSDISDLKASKSVASSSSDEELGDDGYGNISFSCNMLDALAAIESLNIHLNTNLNF